MLLVWTSNLSSIAFSDIEEKTSYVWKAMDKPTIKVSKSQECLYISAILWVGQLQTLTTFTEPIVI